MLIAKNNITKIYYIIILLFTITQVVSQNLNKEKVFSNSIILKSDILQEERDIQIFLPDSYEENSRKYPVLYVIDAQRYFLNGIVFQQNLTWQEIAPEFIVVGINTDAVKRRHLFYKESTKFIQFLEKELIPEINTKYKTLNERIYFGWEMAAGLGVEIFANKPSLFNGFLLASPTHISRDRLEMVSTMLKNNKQLDIKLYTALGTIENWATEPMFSLDSIFQRYSTKNIQWKYNLSDKENHYTTPLTTINEGLKLFFSDYGPIRFYSINEFLDFGGVESLKKHYQVRGEKYQVSEEIHPDTKHYLFLQARKENNLVIFEELMREIEGKDFIKNYYRQARWFYNFTSFYLEKKKLADALEILELGLDKFPNASILYFAKGNYFRTIGKIKEAKEWYKKAIQIARMNNEPELEKYITELKKNTMKFGIVTGSSRGIGLAAVKLLTNNSNTQVIGSSTSGNHTLNLPNFRSKKLNLFNSDSINAFVKNLGDLKLDFLVNNAGVLLEDWETSIINLNQLKNTFDINLFGTIELTEKLLPLLNKEAHIINITSDWGSFSEQNFDAFQPHYKMSKAALNMYTKLLAKRLDNKEITVSSLDPGWTQTDMGGQEASRKPEEVAKDILNLLSNNVKSGQFWHQGKTRDW